MWEKVAKRSHVPKQLFGLGKGSEEEVMLYGTVDYTLKDGRGTTVDWSARAHFVKEGEELKMDFYQVYLVSFFSSSSSGEVKADFLFCRILRPWRMLSKKVLSHLYDISKRNQLKWVDGLRNEYQQNICVLAHHTSHTLPTSPQHAPPFIIIHPSPSSPHPCLSFYCTFVILMISLKIYNPFSPSPVFSSSPFK